MMTETSKTHGIAGNRRNIKEQKQTEGIYVDHLQIRSKYRRFAKLLQYCIAGVVVN